MSCAGCSNKDTEYKLTREEALIYAKKENKTVAITRKPNGDYEYFEANYARTLPGVQIIEYISEHN